MVKDSATSAVQVVANGRDFDPGITIPNGGWNAPLGDLVTYLAFLTNATGGDSAKQRLYDTVLPHATLDAMWEPKFTTGPDSRPGDWMGMSFFVSTPGSVRIVGHTGTQAGFRTFIFLNPAAKTAVIGAFNTIDMVDGALYEAGFRTVRDSSWTLLK